MKNNCCVPRFKLSPQLQILNALFTQPPQWLPVAPFPLELNTNVTSRFVGKSHCPFVTFTSLTPQPSMSTTATPEIIQLDHADFNYTFRYKGRAKWYRVDITNKQVYPLIDIYGNNIRKQREFVIGGYIGYVACISDTDIKLIVTAVFATTSNVYNNVGPFFVTLDGQQVLAATKFAAPRNTSLVPAPRFVALANVLKGLNMLCPILINVPSFPPPGRRLIGGSIVNDLVSLDVIDFQYSEENNLVYFVFSGAPAAATDIVQVQSGGTILYLSHTIDDEPSGTYLVIIDLVLRVKQSIIDNDPQLALSVLGNITDLTAVSRYVATYHETAHECKDGVLVTAPVTDIPNFTLTYTARYTFGLAQPSTYSAYMSFIIQGTGNFGAVDLDHSVDVLSKKFTIQLISASNC